MMKAAARTACIVLLMASTEPMASAGVITMLSLPSVGPNNDLSPSWPQYAANALASLGNGGGNIGDPTTDPTAYAAASWIIAGDLILSSFPSWLGTAAPSGAFAGESGNQLLFGLVISGNGDYFRLSNLYNTMSSSDPFDSLGWNSGGFSAYGTYLVGRDCGADGVCGTADDIVYSNGEDASLPVNQLLYVGVGAAFDASGEPGATDQDKLDSVGAFILSNSPFSVSNTYTLYDDNLSVLASVDSTISEASEVPEPSTLLFAAVGLAGFAVLTRLRLRSSN